MTDKTDCIQKPVLIAIDIAKNKHDVQIKWPNIGSLVSAAEQTGVG